MIISVKRLSAILAFILVDVSTFGGESEDLVEWFSPSSYEDEDLIDKLWKVELCCDLRGNIICGLEIILMDGCTRMKIEFRGDIRKLKSEKRNVY